MCSADSSRPRKVGSAAGLIRHTTASCGLRETEAETLHCLPSIVRCATRLNAALRAAVLGTAFLRACATVLSENHASVGSSNRAMIPGLPVSSAGKSGSRASCDSYGRSPVRIGRRRYLVRGSAGTATARPNRLIGVDVASLDDQRRSDSGHFLRLVISSSRSARRASSQCLHERLLRQ